VASHDCDHCRGTLRRKNYHYLAELDGGRELKRCQLGRRFIGFEIDAATAEQASQRINEAAAPPDTYNAERDFSESINVCYEAVRERVDAGGPTWTPSRCPQPSARRRRLPGPRCDAPPAPSTGRAHGAPLSCCTMQKLADPMEFSHDISRVKYAPLATSRKAVDACATMTDRSPGSKGTGTSVNSVGPCFAGRHALPVGRDVRARN
jgi:hypothetical protein